MLAGIYRVNQLGRATVIAAGLALTFGGGAIAGPVADHATEAEQQAAAGDGTAAITAFDAAVDAFWQAEPLTFRVARFADQITGFGMYTPRADGPFHVGDTVNIYLEPVGYGFAADGDGFRVSYGTGIEIRTPGGLILAGPGEEPRGARRGERYPPRRPQARRLRAAAYADRRRIRQIGDGDISIRHRRVGSAAFTAKCGAAKCRRRSP